MAEAEAYTSSLSASLRPANSQSPSWMNFHLLGMLDLGTKLVVAIAPELTVGLVRASVFHSIPSTELKARPVALSPSFSRLTSTPISWHTSAKMNGLETLIMVNSYCAFPRRVDIADRIYDADAKQAGRHPGQRGIHLGIPALLV